MKIECRITDVTRRYVASYATRTKKMRIVEKWWKGLMMPFTPKSDEAEAEEAELSALQLAEGFPKTLSAFNNHPLYVLEKHVKKFEVLHPRGPVLGQFRNENIYPRSSVKAIASVENYLKQGLVIKEGEVPAKMVKRPKRPVKALRKGLSMLHSSDEERMAPLPPPEPEDRGMAPLYGLWQTKEYDPPEAKDGIVPRNQFGNVDLYLPRMLPKGCVYIPGKGHTRVARKLGIDAAEAVTGFEFHGGR